MARAEVQLKQSLPAKFSSWLVRNCVFPFWVRRDHPVYIKFYAEFQKTQHLPLTELKALQLQRLRKLLRHAFDHCPFYAERMKEAGLVPDQINSLADLARLPVLTKRDIQDHGLEMQAVGFPADKRVRNQTGGSTGSPLQFYVDKERFDSRKASTARHNLWTGLQPGDWQISLWGSRLDQGRPETFRDHLKNNLLYRIVALNTSKITDAHWLKFIDEVRQKKPRAMVAYTQAAVLFARYLRQQEIDDIQIDAIITTAEVLLPGQREILEKAFHGKVFNRYGCREVSVIASECEFHRGMHVNAEALYVEIIPDEGTTKGAGRIVVTDLLNYSMPLIRYEIGDIGEWASNQECPCGRHLPLLADVQGRTTDFLILSDGTHISGPALTLVVSDMADVRQVQFVQKAPELIVLRVVPGTNYGPSTEQELRKRFGLYLNQTTTLRIEMAEGIASEISGKYRFVVHESEPESSSTLEATESENTHART